MMDAVTAYNKAVTGGTFDPSRLDGCRASGIEPPKSNWAQRIDTPPFYGIAMRPGITFTFMGVKVTEEARVRREDGGMFGNVFAAGEIMSWKYPVIRLSRRFRANHRHGLGPDRGHRSRAGRGESE